MNKRDLTDIFSVEDLNELLNHTDSPVTESSAVTGAGRLRDAQGGLQAGHRQDRLSGARGAGRPRPTPPLPPALSVPTRFTQSSGS